MQPGKFTRSSTQSYQFCQVHRPHRRHYQDREPSHHPSPSSLSPLSSQPLTPASSPCHPDLLPVPTALPFPERRTSWSKPPSDSDFLHLASCIYLSVSRIILTHTRGDHLSIWFLFIAHLSSVTWLSHGLFTSSPMEGIWFFSNAGWLSIKPL